MAKRRAARNLSLSEASQFLKIRVPVLKALEEGEWQQISGRVYLKGFLRRYALYLGLDADNLVDPYFQEERSTPPPSEKKEEPQEPMESNVRFWWCEHI